MRRLPFPVRPDLDARLAALGFAPRAADGTPWWDEGACYAFTLAEIERDLEGPSAELHALCLALVARAVEDEDLLTRLGVPARAHDLVRASWRRGDPSLYGRLDLAYDGTGPAKLLEYNADTPTALYEAAVVQWHWLEDGIAAGRLPAYADQFNAVHEALVARWAAFADGAPLHLACQRPSPEDEGTIAYLEHTARQAGIATVRLGIGEVGLSKEGEFVDLAEAPIRRLFKLYPWEWMWGDAFAASPAMARTRFVEPPWKACLSTKAILPLLWAIAPGHPNLLPAYFEDDPARAELGASYVRKPVHSREGANVALVEAGNVVAAAPGPYGASGFVRQALARTAPFAGRHAVVGSWIVGERAAGIGLREDDGPITTDASRFVPHVILG